MKISIINDADGYRGVAIAPNATLPHGYSSTTKNLEQDVAHCIQAAISWTLRPIVERWEKEAKHYHNQHPIPEGSIPAEITPEQQNAANLSGILRAKAHELKSLLKTHS